MNGSAFSIAVPTGRLQEETAQLFARAGLDMPQVDDRRLIVPSQGLRWIFCRPSDVPALVRAGAADAGVAGKDAVLEDGDDVVEAIDLGIGVCRLSVAAKRDAFASWSDLVAACPAPRIATKFPRIARRFLEEEGVPGRVIALHGSLEIAPLLDLSDAILDIVATGQTLAAHDLREVAILRPLSARLIFNPSSLRWRTGECERLMSVLEGAVSAQADGSATSRSKEVAAR